MAVAFGVFVVIGAFDYRLQKWLFVRRNRQSKDEQKREHKESDGNPEMKGERKRLARELSQEGPKRGIGRATVVVVNPVHYAVALRYDPAEFPLPVVLARGVDSEALLLRRHERRGRGDKPASFALKKAGGIARKTAVAPMRLQALAERQGASPTRAQTLADGYARELIGLGRELQGGDRHAQRQSLHLMLPLALLSACSRMAMKRQPAQLQAQINSALAQPGNGTVGARLLGHTLDLTLARQRFRIDYDDNEQSLSMVRQRLMDATAATAAPAAPGGVSGGVAAPSAPRSPGAS